MASKRTVPLTARVPPSVVERLKALAAVEERSVSFLVAEALLRYLETEEWQVAEIQAAVAEARAHPDDFITDEEMNAETERLLADLEAQQAAAGNRAPAA